MGEVRRGQRRADRHQLCGNKATSGSAVCRLLDTFDKMHAACPPCNTDYSQALISAGPFHCSRQ